MTLSKKKNQLIYTRHVTILFTYLLIVWGFYRFLFRLPDEIEEVVIKPLLWGLPVLYLVKKEGLGLKSLGVNSENMISSVYLALGLGSLFAIEGVLLNFVKYQGINFSANLGDRMIFLALGLSLVTAVTEELTFRGYIFGRLEDVMKNTFAAVMLSSLMWGMIHLPVSVLWFNLSPSGVLGYFLLTTVFGIGSAFIYSRTRNIFSSIILHVLWVWPIILFR